MHKHQFRSQQSLWSRTRECHDTAVNASNDDQIELENASEGVTLDIRDASAERTSILEDLVAHSGGKTSAPDILKKLKNGSEKLNDQSVQRMGFLQDILAKAGINTIGDITERVNQLGTGSREALYRETMNGLAQFDPSLAAQLPQGLKMGMQGTDVNVRMQNPFNLQVYPMNGAPYAVNAAQGNGAYAAAMHYPEGSFAIARTNAGNYPVWPHAYPNMPSMPHTYEAQHRMDIFRKILQMIISLLLMLLQKKKEEPVYDIEDDEDEVTLEPKYDIEGNATKQEPEPVKEEPKKEPEPVKEEPKKEPEKTKEPERPKDPEKSPEAIIKEIVAKANAKMKKDDPVLDARAEEIAGNIKEVVVFFREGDRTAVRDVVTIRPIASEIDNAVLAIVEKAKELKIKGVVNADFIEKISKGSYTLNETNNAEAYTTTGVTVEIATDKKSVTIKYDGRTRTVPSVFGKDVVGMRKDIAEAATKMKLIKDAVKKVQEMMNDKKTGISGVSVGDQTDKNARYTFSINEAGAMAISEFTPRELKAKNLDDAVTEIFNEAKQFKRGIILSDKTFEDALQKEGGARLGPTEPLSVDKVMIITSTSKVEYNIGFEKTVTFTQKDMIQKAKTLKEESERKERTQEELSQMVTTLLNEPNFRGVVHGHLKIGEGSTILRKPTIKDSSNVDITYGTAQESTNAFKITLDKQYSLTDLRDAILAGAKTEFEKRDAWWKSATKKIAMEIPGATLEVGKQSAYKVDFVVIHEKERSAPLNIFFSSDAASVENDLLSNVKKMILEKILSETFRAGVAQESGIQLSNLGTKVGFEGSTEEYAPNFKDDITKMKKNIRDKAIEVAKTVKKMTEEDLKEGFDKPKNKIQEVVEKLYPEITVSRSGREFTFKGKDTEKKEFIFTTELPVTIKDAKQMRWWIYDITIEISMGTPKDKLGTTKQKVLIYLEYKAKEEISNVKEP